MNNTAKIQYQETKLGQIPIEWISTTLESAHIDVIDGDRGKNYPKENELLDSGHCVFLNAGNVTKSGLSMEKAVFISKEKDEKLRKGKLQRGDIVVTTRGTTGNFALYSDEIQYEHIRINSGMAIIRNTNKKVDQQYLFAFLNSQIIENYIKRISFGSAQPQLTIGIIKKLPFLFPSLLEQKKIAEIFTTWDNAIQKIKKIIDLNIKKKNGLVNQLIVGHRRLPIFSSSVNFMKSHFYSFPEDWNNLKISSFGNEITLRNGSSNLEVLSCTKHDGFVDSMTYFGKKVFSNDTSNYKVIKKNQFGFPSNHVEEGSIGILKHRDEGIVSPIYIVFEVDETIVLPEYLYIILKTETYRHIFSISTNASVDRRGSLRWKDFSNISVPIPPIEEQKKILEIIVTMDKELHVYRSILEKYRTQRNSLMRKLFNGAIRV